MNKEKLIKKIKESDCPKVKIAIVDIVGIRAMFVMIVWELKRYFEII